MNVVQEREPQLQVQTIVPLQEGELSLVERARLEEKFGLLKKDNVAIPDAFKDAFKAPEEKKDINMDVPWSSFGQMLFVKEHTLESGEKVKKIAAVSISYPSGVRTRMTEAIMKNTLSSDISIQRWNGVKEGELQAASISHGTNDPDLSVLNRFIDVSENVIAASHHDTAHKHVQHFMGLQDARREFMDTVKEDVSTILDTPSFLKKSAFDPRYKDKGIYVLEMYMGQDGELFGVDPKGEPMKIIDIAADQPHKEWLTWLKKSVAQDGNATTMHADGTETVSGCGGDEKACADFFEEMEGKASEKVIFEEPTYKKFMTLPTLSMSWDGDSTYACKVCKEKSSCTCTKTKNTDETDGGAEA